MASTNRDAIFINAGELTALSSSNPLGSYIQRIYKRRFYIWADAKAKAFQAGRDTYLGKTWLIGEPLLTAVLYGSVFGLLLRTSKGIDNFIGFLLIGIMFFGLLNKTMSSGAGLIRGSKSMLTAFDFPTAIIPLATALRITLDALPGLILSILVAIALQPEKPLHASIIAVVPILVLMILFATGLLFMTARLTAFFPDGRIIIGFLSSAWFFLSGIFYSLQRYASHPSLFAVLSKNPGYFYVQAIRESVLEGNWPSLSSWALMTLTAIGTLAIGFVFFWKAENRYRDVD